MSGTVSTKALTLGVVIAAIAGGLGTHFVIQNLGNQQSMYPIELTPDNSSNVLEAVVTDSSKKCKQNDNKGCVQFDVDKVGMVKFYLPNSKYKTKSCKNNNEVITKVELTTTGSGDKGTFVGHLPLPAWIKENAFPSVDRSTGIAYQADLQQARTQVFLANMNNHDASEGTKTFWYQVTVTDCDDESKQWVTDPRGDNKGMN